MTYPNVYATQTGPLALSGLDANFLYAVDIANAALTATAGGSADALTATYSPAPAALVAGLTLYLRAAQANATTTPQFSPNGLTGKVIVKNNNQALAVGDIAGAGHWLQLVYDATNGVWELMNPATVVGAVQTGGTANGVAYLNGSKVLTTGTGFVFDGTNVGIGTSSPGTQLNVYKSTATAVNIRPQNSLGYADFGLQADGSVYGPYASPAASTQLLAGTANSNPFTFYTNGSERMRVNAGAPILCLSGGNTSATGTGIAFPATQSASSDVNTLDDYEEGTWTPVINPAVGTVTSSVVAGTYVKVGRQVTLNYDARITGGTITSVASISGFPFATGSAAVAASGSCREYNAVGQLWNLTAGASSTIAGLVNYVNSTTVTNAYAWSGTFVYQTT